VAKELHFDKDARQKLLAGIRPVAKLVGSTMGPRGLCAVIERQVTDQSGHVQKLQPVISKDGITCARAIVLSDPTENMGADLIKEAGSRSLAEAGDGTSASIVLCHSIFSYGLKALDEGFSSIWLRSGIEKAVARVVELISRMSIPVGDRIFQVANIAANGDKEIATTVTEALKLAGPNGIVSVDQSRSDKTHIDFSSGMSFDSGLRYQDFCSDAARGECVLENPYLLLHEQRLQSITQIDKILKGVVEQHRPILFISEEFELPIVGLLLANLAVLKSCCVVSPWFGERRKDFLKDLAVFTGGVAVTTELGLELKNSDITILGQCEKAVITKGSTTLIGGKFKEQEMKDRISTLKHVIATSENAYEKEVCAERLAKLDGGVAVIKIGAATQSECKEKQDRCEDSVLSVKSSQEEGIVPGGGIALLRASENRQFLDWIETLSPEEKRGAEIVKDALEAPIRQILANGGYQDEVLHNVQGKEQNYGFDAMNGVYCDMLDAGIVDASRVVKQALINASSLAGTLLTCSGTVVNLPENK
jgi:chaperonin GroEL